MKIQRLVACIFVLLLVSAAWSQNQKKGTQRAVQATVRSSGDSTLDAKISGTVVRIVISAYEIDIGEQGEPPEIRKNNCTYSSYPCSQVSSLRIWVNGANLFVPRSVFAECTDVGNMRLTTVAGFYILTLTGGDASEAYSVKIYFTAHQVKKRVVYDLEANSMCEYTTYLPPTVLE
jgi:hypothetical protein